MSKLRKKQRSTTKATFHYLYEVSSIPSNIRSAYLEKLLQRKNSAGQKNIELLTLIYMHVEENIIPDWDSKKIQKTLGLTTTAFYKHRSRLLNGLRAYYFGWKEKEKTIENEFYLSNSPDSAELLLEKARCMAKLGMDREAKCAFRKLEKTAGKKDILLLSEVYEFFSNYYRSRRDQSKLVYYKNQFKKLKKYSSFNLTDSDNALIKIRRIYSVFNIYTLLWHKNPDVNIPKRLLDDIYTLAKKYGHEEYLKISLYHKNALCITKARYEEAIEICKEGCRVSEFNSLEYHTFAGFIYFAGRKLGKNSAGSNQPTIDYFNSIKNTYPYYRWSALLANCILICYQIGPSKKLIEIARFLVSSNIMKGDYSFSFYWKFMYETEMFNMSLSQNFEPESIKNRGYLTFGKVDKQHISVIENTCRDTLSYQKELSNQGFIWAVYKFSLLSAFLDEDDTDFARAYIILKKVDWMVKKKRKLYAYNTFSILKLAFRMLEKSSRQGLMLKRYEYKFRKVLDHFKDNIMDYTMLDYAILSSLARRLRCSAVTQMVREFYGWLSDKHPEILAPVMREIEERKAKIYVVDGSKQNAQKQTAA